MCWFPGLFSLTQDSLEYTVLHAFIFQANYSKRNKSVVLAFKVYLYNSYMLLLHLFCFVSFHSNAVMA